MFAPLLLYSHHVIPQGDGHLSMSSLTDVEAVHREETGVSLTHLVENTGTFYYFCMAACFVTSLGLYNLLQYEG